MKAKKQATPGSARASADRATQPAPPADLLMRAWQNTKDFWVPGADATLLWPRWIVLRAVGVVFVFVFAGIIDEGRALVSPAGVSPLAAYLADVKKLLPGSIEAFFGAPSLFWLGTGTGMIATLAWAGLVAAVAVVLNFWPRLALFVCWVVLLSFVSTWNSFSPAQLDGLMLETALLCIPFAPRGVRPRLGADSPPRPIAVFMMRWMLFRVMLESGLVKIVSADPHWRNLTAMDVLYETAPSPTILGYFAHQLPHAYHVFEIAFTFAAELLAPLLAAFGGRRGRWWALLLWTALQAGIQLTCNFGWLNTAAFGLGLLLLDDQMLATAADKLGLATASRFLAQQATSLPARAIGAWRLYGLRAALGIHFCLTLYYFAKVCRVPVEAAPAVISSPVKFFGEFRSANGYKLYANFETAHYQVDFEGSNDAGKTWRTYEFRTVPQQVDRMPPFFAPRFARLETTIQIDSSKLAKFTVVPLVAAHLLAQNPNLINRFERDPFPDRPPMIVRMRRYRLAFTDSDTHRRTGHYWHKEFAGEYLPAMYLTERGKIAQFSLVDADTALNAGNYPTAFRDYERQYQLGNLDAGFRLADMYSRGLGAPEQPGKVFALFSDLAERGEVKALHNLGLCYEHGIGVPADFPKAVDLYRRAADRGNLLSIYRLGALSAQDRIVPRDDIEGLSSLLRAAARATGDDSLPAHLREDQPVQLKRLMDRMPPGDIAKARLRAAARR